MRKTTKFGLSSVVVAGVMGAVLMPAASAFATADPAAPTVSFACPEGTDTIDVPFAFDADSNPELAGTVCVRTGTTVFESMNITDGWSAELKSAGTKGRTEVRFSNESTRDRVELRYEAGRTEIKH